VDLGSWSIARDQDVGETSLNLLEWLDWSSDDPRRTLWTSWNFKALVPMVLRVAVEPPSQRLGRKFEQISDVSARKECGR